MYREFFAKSPLLAFPMLSLALFIALFVVAVAYVVARGRKLETLGALPLAREVDDE
jgi:hypothetical protein